MQVVGRNITGLHDAGLGVDQPKHPLTGGEPVLELTPKRSNLRERKPEEHKRLNEEVPIAHAHSAGGRFQTAEIDDDCGAKTGCGVEHRKEGIQHDPLPEVYPVRLLVDANEVIMHRLLLAKYLSYGDTANRLLDVGVDLRHDAPRMQRGFTGNASEQERNSCDKRRHRHRNQPQLQIDHEQHAPHQQHQHHLTDEIHRKRDCLSEPIRV